VSDAAPVVPRLAATVLVLRDSADGPQVYFMRRPARSSFAASAYVFPGGAVDDADGSDALLALAPGFDRSLAAARMRLDDVGIAGSLHVAAVREVFEETGILIGVHADGSPLGADDVDVLATARALLLGGARFEEVLSHHGLRMAPQRLVYVAHFITPEGEPRRYDTRFFAVEAPLEQEAAHHAAEATASGWYTAAQALAMTGGEFTLMLPPTRIMCREVSAHADVDSVLRDLGTRPVDAILFNVGDVLSGRLPTSLPAAWPPPS
jgi:8-oxo-dGTP pyrophosphatase MutT (NUDIX family)